MSQSHTTSCSFCSMDCINPACLVFWQKRFSCAFSLRGPHFSAISPFVVGCFPRFYLKNYSSFRTPNVGVDGNFLSLLLNLDLRRKRRFWTNLWHLWESTGIHTGLWCGLYTFTSNDISISAQAAPHLYSCKENLSHSHACLIRNRSTVLNSSSII